MCRVAFAGSYEIKDSERSTLQYLYPGAEIRFYPSGNGAGSGDLARLEQVGQGAAVQRAPHLHGAWLGAYACALLPVPNTVATYYLRWAAVHEALLRMHRSQPVQLPYCTCPCPGWQVIRGGNPPDVVYCRVRWVDHRTTYTIKPLCKTYSVPLIQFTPQMFLRLKRAAAKGRGDEAAEDEEAGELQRLQSEWEQEDDSCVVR